MIRSAILIISLLSFSTFALAQGVGDGGGGGVGGGGGGSGGAMVSPGGTSDYSDSRREAEQAEILRNIRDNKVSARPKFANLFDQTQKAIVKDDMQKADTLVLKLRELTPINDYERSRMHLIDYWYYGKKGNKELENEAASKLLAVGAGNIDAPAFVEAGMRLLKRQYNNQDLGGSIETLNNLRKEPTSQSELMSVLSVVKKLDDFAEQQTDIVQKITVNETGVWSAKLLKSHFFFNGINGEITTLAFNCANKQATLNYKADSVMEIPEAWGSCVMTVTAKPNTTFNLVQLQKKPA